MESPNEERAAEVQEVYDALLAEMDLYDIPPASLMGMTCEAMKRLRHACDALEVIAGRNGSISQITAADALKDLKVKGWFEEAS